MSTPDSDYVSTATRTSLLVLKTFSHEPTRSDSERSARYRRRQSVLSNREDDPPPNYATALTEYCFMGKVAQLLLTIISAVLFAEGSKIISVTRPNMFPHVVYGSYIIIMGIIIMSYLLGQKMHEMLIRLFLILGTFLFLASSCFVLNVLRKNWVAWENPENATHLQIVWIKQKRSMLLVQGLLGLVVAGLMVADLGLSIRRSFMQRG